MATSQGDPTQTMASRRFVVLLVFASVIGVITALAAWCFLELIHQLQVGVYKKLPEQVGYDQMPEWWPVPFAVLAGVIVAFAITRLPGRGGHVPAHGLSTDPIGPIDLGGVLLAAIATISLGLVLGPEAPLIALGSGLGLLAVQRLRRDAQPQLGALMAACGMFSALALIFGSPLIAAVLLIEATGLGGAQLRLVLVPGLLAAGIGSLVSIGMGSWTGLSNSDYALGAVPLPQFDRPDLADVLWTVPLGVAIAVGSWAIFRLALSTEPLLARRPFVMLPLAGASVAGLAIVFAELTDKGVDQVLFDGQDALSGLTSGAGSWSLGALGLLLVIKGLAWAISLAGFRGGPTFPAMFLGAAAGIAASHLPGFDLTPAVAIGLGAGVAAVLRLPLSGIVLAALLTAHTGAGSTPLVILGVVAAYLTALALPEPAQPDFHPDRVTTASEPERTVVA
jgi:H+/Cl- antiporter ClcA